MTSRLAILLLLMVGLVAPARAAEPTDDVRLKKAAELFQAYVRLERAFDPALADLYADDAVIRNTRTDASGQASRLEIPAPDYKAMVRKVMPAARGRGDLNTYSHITYTIEGEGVRIKADRFSELKKYHSPLSLLVRPSPAGAWLIYEERSQTRL